MKALYGKFNVTEVTKKYDKVARKNVGETVEVIVKNY
jgi:hypothetical protein